MTQPIRNRIIITIWIVSGSLLPLSAIASPEVSDSQEIRKDSITTDNHATQLLGIAPTEQKTDRSKAKQPVGSIKAGIGPVWTTSRVYMENNRDYETNIRGTGFGASVTTLRWGCTGIGLDFYLSRTTIEHRTYGRIEDLSFTQFYLGPSFVCGGRLIDRLRGEATFGLGLAVHSDTGQNELGFGIHSSLGLEFMITPKIGIGVEGVNQKHLFKKPDGYNTPNDESYGYQQLGVLFGLRTYF
jgi:hypothetical protein